MHVADTEHTILVVNPGSTSTKIAIFSLSASDSEPVEKRTESIGCDVVEDMYRDYENRVSDVSDFIGDDSIDIIAARGGMVAPVSSGVFTVNEAMIDDLLSCRFGRHASNLGAPIASAVAKKQHCTAIIADPVGVDDFSHLARVSGFVGLERKSFSHALNLRARARRAAADIGIAFDTSRLIGIHLGGGVSVAAIVGGRIIDVNNSNEGGPFTPQRAGSLPILQLIDLCYSGKYETAHELKSELTTEGGLVSYLGTSDVREILDRIEAGDAEARDIIDAMIYQIAKEAGAMASVLEGKIHGVFVTGGFARKPLSIQLAQKLGWLGRIFVYPGEGEMEALARAAARVLRGEEDAREYTRP